VTIIATSNFDNSQYASVIFDISEQQQQPAVTAFAYDTTFVGSVQVGTAATMRYGAVVEFFPDNTVSMILTFNLATMIYTGTYTKEAAEPDDAFVDYFIVITYFARQALGVPPVISQDEYNTDATVLNLELSGEIINGFRPQMAGDVPQFGLVPGGDIVLILNGPFDDVPALDDPSFDTADIFVGSHIWQGSIAGAPAVLHMSVILFVFEDDTFVVRLHTSAGFGMTVIITGTVVLDDETTYGNVTTRTFSMTQGDGSLNFSTNTFAISQSGSSVWIDGFRISAQPPAPFTGGAYGAFMVRIIV
jgi:hypothetical protein